MKAFLLLFIMFLNGCVGETNQVERPRIAIPEKNQVLESNLPKKISGFFVNPKSSKTNPKGTSWEEAFSNIEDAINLANGADIFLAAGTYTNQLQITDKSNIRLIGGYDVGEVNEKVKDFKETIFDGVNIEILGNSENIFLERIIIKNNKTDPAIKVTGNSADKRVKNITLSHVTLEDNNIALNGAGVYAEHVWGLNLNFITAKNNQANEGAGVYVKNSFALAVTGGNFIENRSLSNGAGIYIEGVSNTEGFSVYKTSFEKNGAPMGSGIYIKNLNKSVFDDLRFTKNIGSAFYIENSKDIKLNNIEAKENKALNGGFLYTLNQENLFINNSKIDNNEATQKGGGLYIRESKGTFKVNSNEFKQNIAKTADGGAIYFELPNCVAEIDASLFKGNSAAQRGGALAIDATNLATQNALKITIDKNTNFEVNAAKDDFGGGAMAIFASNLIAPRQVLFLKEDIKFLNNTAKDEKGRNISLYSTEIDKKFTDPAINHASFIYMQPNPKQGSGLYSLGIGLGNSLYIHK